MKVAYLDTSCVAAIEFSEPGGAAMKRRLTAFDQLVSSNLLEAELRSVCHREGRAVPLRLVDSVVWIHPARALSQEIERVLAAGYLRGGDCWHVATALFAALSMSELHFLTLDVQQARVARALGFPA